MLHRTQGMGEPRSLGKLNSFAIIVSKSFLFHCLLLDNLSTMFGDLGILSIFAMLSPIV
jgi:hypothetical protein